jgi:transposase-like protein
MGMKCWNSTFKTQGLRGIIIVIQVGTMKIYVAIMKVFKKKERHGETQFTTKVDGY